MKGQKDQGEGKREQLPGCLSPAFQTEERPFEALSIQARPLFYKDIIYS